MGHSMERAILEKPEKNFHDEIIYKKRSEWWVGVNASSEQTRCVKYQGRETERN